MKIFWTKKISQKIKIIGCDLAIKLSLVFIFCFLFFFGLDKIIPGQVYAVFPVDLLLVGAFLMSFLVIEGKKQGITDVSSLQEKSPVFFRIAKLCFFFLLIFLTGVYFLKFWQNKAEKLFLFYFPPLVSFVFLVYYLWKREDE